MNMAVIPVCLILFLLAVQGTTAYQLSPPRIMTYQGNLVIMPASNRHIRIRTTGTGRLYYNDYDLMQMLVEARNASSTLRKLKLDSQSINKFQRLMNGAGGILQRLGALEAQVNASAPSGAARATLAVVKSLQRKVNMLETQLRRLRVDLAANECASNPCLNGGTCEDKYKGFICRCPRNWEGRTCNVDVNECLTLAGTDLGCQNGATCLNKPGTYECFCAQGWFGVHCTQQSQACTQQSSSALCGHGICQNTGGGQYSCLCDQGWTNNPIMCTKDVDECASNTALCSRNPPVRCVNVPGSFYCEACPQGYIGDGYQCSDIDECQENNGGCSVNPFVQCFNTQGSSRCGACPAGYQGDGVMCNFVGICSFNNGGCHPLAQCVTNTGISQTYRQCICPTGYAGNGEGANGCTVDTGITSVCRNNPCGPHGNCISIGGSDTYTCNCLPGYTGVHCNSLTDPCSNSPCQNGGTCVQHDNVRYTCRCSESYTGQNCERRQLSCGGYLTSEEGILKFPEEESSMSYPHGMSCAWVIITNATKVINITFTRFDLEHSSGCQYDWLQVHDGNSPGDQLIGRYCGSTPPRNGTFISTHNKLYFWFRSDVNINKEGFEFTWNSIEPVCGKTIDPATFGTISSPGSPGKYPPNRDCAWLLHAPVGKRLQFHFFNLLIESHSTCDHDYLKFFSGANERDPVIQEFCNSSHPEPLISPGRTVLIYFHSDSEGSDGGFQIAYSTIEGFPGCGGIITTPSGSISSPNHPNNYIGRLDCEWKIQFPKRTRIRIDFSTFALEASSNCRFDFLEIRDGNSIDSPLIGRFCGSEIPASFLSNGNALFIYFHTDSSQHDAGFVMNYKTICGGIFSSPIGDLTSPLYPNLYPNAIECIYEIEQPLSQAINLQFQDFQVESFYYYTEKPQCSYDKIEIHDGHDEYAPLIGTYCGSNAPPPVISTSNYLWMKFTTDGSYRNRGFYANYTTFSIACGGILKQSEGTIHSPQYPEIYLPGQSCRWVLVAPQSKVIQLTFNSFHMEHHSNCIYDYVEVYDNSTTLSNYMGRFCGNNKPPTLTSSGNILTINFKSDSSRGYEGFNAQFKHLNASSICGGTYYSTMGRLQSPNYPNFYPHTLDCTWLINTQEGQLIRVNISVFEIEQSLNCRYDYLEIRNGGYSTSPLIGKFCGTDIPRLFSSHSNKMYFRFVSDSSRTAKGFLISWDGTTNGCGGTLTSPTGSFTSPNYPETYGHNAVCTYKITVNRGSRIQLVLIDLELEESDTCRFDYIEIRDGILSSSKVLGKYCSNSHLRTITSSSNSLLVKFRSDSSHSARGFHINYFTVCDNDLRGFHGIVESPNFPSLYPNNMQCSWKIHAPRGNNISITFSHFELEGEKILSRSSSNEEKYICNSDYLEIKEYFDQEVTGTLTQLGEALCGTDLPQTVQSQFNNVILKFVTDSYIQMSGFRLEWIVQGCGGHLDRPFGEFSSPGYPYGYKDNMECEWTITVDLASSVELTFENFSLEQSVVCGFDAISIYGGIDNTSYLIDRICHSQHGPLTYTSSGNNMFIHFVSDSSYRGRGFHASYKAVPSTCGGKFAAPTGSIHSKNYPNFYDENEDCIWLIEVAPTHRINLTFINIDIPTSVNCSRGSIEVYDGNSTDSSNQMLTQLCGSLTNSTTVISSSNYLLIHFQSKGSKGKGFKADYHIICGARIETEDSGLISLGESIKGFSRLNCSWIIVGTRPEDRVTLTITHMDMMTAEACFSSSVVVRDGEDDSAPLIGQYCGTRHPPHITSQGNAIFVRVQSHYSSNLVRFRATYSVTWTACGGALTSEHGSFASPGFPESYPLELECVWTIVTSPGNRAMITFSSFELGPSVPGGSCDEDYLEIRKENMNGALLGLYCGNNVPLNLTAAHSFWVKFRSTKSGGGSGFLASYSLMHGNELEGESGQIASPMFPASYVQEGEFNWRVTVNMSYAIRITFKEFFIEKFSSTCHDYLAVYDGYDNTAQELFKGCGGQLPDPLTSSSNVIYISFTIDPFKVGGYFFLEWLEVKLDNYDYQRVVKNATGCDRIHVLDTMLNTSSVNISSPGYPNTYPPTNCEWILETSQNNHISIFIRDMDLQDFSEHCYGSSVQIFTRRTQSNNWELQHTLCLSNSTNLGFIHGTNLMKVVFSSYYSNAAKRGFLATAFTECGGSIESPNGIIEISNKTLFTSQFYGRYNCEWNITVHAGRTVRIKFEHFDVPSGKGSMCSMRYIMLKNGGSKDSPLLGKGKYCGSTPEIIETTSNKAYVYYTAPRNTGGFRLKFEEVSLSCGSNIMLTHEYNFTQISSPNYQNIPPPHIECIWIITAPAGERIYIDFEEHFSLSFNCEKEYLELRDGGTILSKSLAVLCGTSTPTSYTTSGNTLYIKYFTDIDDPNYGFKANVSIAKCGGVIRQNRGKLFSPGYPNGYDNNLHCEWRIITMSYNILNITIKEVDLTRGFKCDRKDRITLSDQIMGNSTEIGTYCGTLSQWKPKYIQSLSNEVLITFDSESVPHKTGRGFVIEFQSEYDECQTKINAPEGEISSPGYPSSPPSRKYCSWIITVPKGRRVTVDMIDFDFDPTLIWDFPSEALRVFNGGSYNLIAVLTANNAVTKIESTSNIMMITFYSYSYTSHRGFKLRFSSDFPQVCGGDIQNSSGIIESPSEGLNLRSYYCNWKWQSDMIQASNGTTYVMELINVTTAFTTPHCRRPTARISFLSESQQIPLKVVCMNVSSPLAILSPYTNTEIEAQQGSNRNLSFTLRYSVSSCGGIIQWPENNITSPNYPMSAEPEMHCAWAINFPDNQIIKVKFLDVQIQGSECDKHYFVIHNGPTVESPTIGKFCRLPDKEIKSQTNKLWIEYHSGPSPTGRGFKLELSPDVKGCGGIIHGKEQEITSPNYPKQYPNNAECEWEIRVQEGYHIVLNFIDRFQLENSNNCENDFVQIYDFAWNEWVPKGKVCGRNLPSTYKSTTNQMKVLFRSNDKTQGDGFKAMWTVGCGAIITNTSSGTIISPGYPDSYGPNLSCNYTIHMPGHFVEASFIDFVLEQGNKMCDFDNVTLFGRRNFWETDQTRFGIFCGYNMPSSIVSRDTLTVIFKSDSWVEKKGFLMKFKINECGGVMNSPGLIVSPTRTEFESDYEKINCTWQINAPTNMVVSIRFSSFSLANEYNCRYGSQSIVVYDNPYVDEEKSLGKFCSNLTNALPVLVSSNNYMTMTYMTYPFKPTANFSAFVLFSYGPAQGCGGTFEVSTQRKEIKSLDINNDGQYESFLDCHWVLLGQEGHVISLEITSMNIATCENSTQTNRCSCDFIEIRDGAGPFSELLGIFCGENIPQKIVTSSQNMWVRFVSDGTKNAAGFRAQVYSEESVCGPTKRNVTSTTQILTSPNYPNNYVANTRCSWILYLNESNPFGTINIRIEDLNIPGGGVLCSDASLTIADTKNAEFISEGLGKNMIFSGASQILYIYSKSSFPIAVSTFCATGHALDVYSGTKTVKVTFKASSVVGKGFKLSFASAGCSRNYTGVQGRIKINTYTYSCTMMIQAMPNTTISLYVLSFYIGYSCKDNYLKVYDGSTTSAPLLSNMCGGQTAMPVFSNSSTMLLQLTSTSSTSSVDIDFTYTSTDKGRGCGGTIYNTAGSFTSPLYPENIRVASNCRWEIVVPTSTKPYLHFEVFNIGTQSACKTDYLEIFDINENTGEETKRTKLCGGDTPAPIEGQTRKIAVVYATSVNNGGTGWVISFIAKHPDTIIES